MGKLTAKHIAELERVAAEAGIAVPAGLALGMSASAFWAWVKKSWEWIWQNRKKIWTVIKRIIDDII